MDPKSKSPESRTSLKYNHGLFFSTSKNALEKVFFFFYTTFQVEVVDKRKWEIIYLSYLILWFTWLFHFVDELLQINHLITFYSRLIDSNISAKYNKIIIYRLLFLFFSLKKKKKTNVVKKNRYYHINPVWWPIVYDKLHNPRDRETPIAIGNRDSIHHFFFFLFFFFLTMINLQIDKQFMWYNKICFFFWGEVGVDGLSPLSPSFYDTF